MCPIISAIIQIIRIRASIVFYLIRTSRFSSYHQLHNISYSNVPTLMDPVQGRLDNHQFGECLDSRGHVRMDRVQRLQTSKRFDLQLKSSSDLRPKERCWMPSNLHPPPSRYHFVKLMNNVKGKVFL